MYHLNMRICYLWNAHAGRLVLRPLLAFSAHTELLVVCVDADGAGSAALRAPRVVVVRVL